MSKEQEETAACALGTTDLIPQPSRFTKSEKWFIVGFVTFVGIFSIMPGFGTLPD